MMEGAGTVWLCSILIALATVPSVLMNRRGHPVAAMSWILALVALPPFALIAWWLIGRLHLQRRRRLKRQASHAIRQALHPEIVRGVTDQDQTFPAVSGNRVAVLPNAERVHAHWADLISTARDHIHLLFFTWKDDGIGRRMRDLLCEAVQTGCTVRVLYDAVGSNHLPSGFFAPLTAAGGQVAPFMPGGLLKASPTINFRNHRKLIIADGRRAYTGGINVADEYLRWQDLGLSIEGPAVHQLQQIFVDDWSFTRGEDLVDSRYFPDIDPLEGEGSVVCQSVASGPDQTYNSMRDQVFLAITQCRDRLWIATPYFVPDDALMMALRSAVLRGVEVHLFVPARSDSWLVHRASRAYYPQLLDSGIAILEYDGMLHAKAFLFDFDRVLVGSANLDTRSVRLNFEAGTFVTGRPTNAALQGFFDHLRVRSQVIGRQDVEKHAYGEQLLDAAAHLLSPLL